MVWDYLGHHPRYRAGDIIYKHTKNTEYRSAVNSALHLVETLTKKTFSSPTAVREYFVSGTSPLFSTRLAEKIYRKLYLMKGGAQGVVGDMVESTSKMIVDTVFGDKPQESNIHNILFFANEIETNGIPFLPFIPVALISTSIEIVVEFLLNAATDIEVLEPWAGIIPLPEAGAIGGVVGEMIKAVLSFLAAAIAISRKDYETGFEALLLSVPFVGLMIQRAYKSEEKITGKYKEKVTSTLNNLPSVQNLMSQTSEPSPLPPPPPPAIGGTRRHKRVKHKRRHKHKWTRRR